MHGCDDNETCLFPQNLPLRLRIYSMQAEIRTLKSRLTHVKETSQIVRYSKNYCPNIFEQLPVELNLKIWDMVKHQDGIDLWNRNMKILNIELLENTKEIMNILDIIDNNALSSHKIYSQKTYSNLFDDEQIMNEDLDSDTLLLNEMYQPKKKYVMWYIDMEDYDDSDDDDDIPFFEGNDII